MTKQAKKNIQRYLLQQSGMKQQTRRSFEKQLSDNPQFDDYIKSQFQKMIQQKGQNPILIIPSGFKKFINTKLFKQLLKKIYQYTDMMLTYQSRYQQAKNSDYNSNSIQILRHQSNALEQKCKQVSYVYMGILLSHAQSKCVFKDQYFFETMVYFLAKVLQSNFQPSDFPRVQQQLNRIFRTDAFNLIKRRHEQDKIYDKLPILKEVKYDCQMNTVNTMMKRLVIQKKHNYSMHIRPEKVDRLPKPIDISISTFKSIHSRSPLIASYYPSYKQKLHDFSQEVREKGSFIKYTGRSRYKK